MSPKMPRSGSGRRSVLATLVCLMLGMPLVGCELIAGGDGPPMEVAMHRPADRAIARCFAGVYPNGGILHANGETEAEQFLDACVAACRKHGFVEDATPRNIHQGQAVPELDNKWGGVPEACRG